MRFAPLMIAAGLLVAADEPDASELEGTWTIVSFERGGEVEEVELELTFEDGRYTLPEGSGFSESTEGTYVLDEEDGMKQISVTPSDGPEEGKTIMGIYRIEGDRMEACYDLTGASRPMTFEAKPGSQFILVKYEKREP